jgi:hypothetical protein
MAAADAIRTYGPNSAAAVNATQSPNTAKYDVTGTPNGLMFILPTSVDLSVQPLVQDLLL